MSSNELKFNFLKDIPVGNNQEEIFEFYHNQIAPALKNIIENDSCVHTIGLFSKWGTGKSTIIEMIKKDSKDPIFVFDAWKYQDDSLRRIFLIELVEFLKEKGEKIDESILFPLYKTKEEHRQEKISKKEIKGFEKGKLFVKKNAFALLAVVLIAIWSFLNKYHGSNIIITSIKDFCASLGSLSLLIVATKPLLEKIWKDSVKKFFSSLDPLTKMKTIVEREERLNSPEQFERLFKDVLKSIDKRIVIVFDNIDRVQGDTAIKILSTIKTFLDPVGLPGLTFIVPCDSVAINKQITGFYKGVADKDEAFDVSEYLRKLFNVIIWTPEFIESDLHAYIKSLIRQTGEVQELLDNEDVIYVISKAFPNNPREIKQFINNLIASLILASKTSVWDIIKNDIAYLAKVLVLKQKYDSAYRRLKDKWFEPENILTEKDPDDLKDFMTNTSRISVSNAEPFIYFKEPVMFKNLDNSEALMLSLVEGDKKKANEFISAEISKSDSIVEFVELLLSKYRGQVEILYKIFVTHIEVFDELNIVTARKIYFETLAKVLDEDLWQFFVKMPTNLIFSSLINKTELNYNSRQLLIERYILALGSDELRQDKSSKVLIDILLNLKSQSVTLSSKQKVQIAGFIHEVFSERASVMGLFETIDEQKSFISSQSLEKFINITTRQTLANNVSILIKYKDFILQNKLADFLLQKLAALVQEDINEHPDFRPEKEALMTRCQEILYNFKDSIKSADEANKTQLAIVLNQAFNGIGGWDNRAVAVNSLRWLSLQITDPGQLDVIKANINGFFQSASPSSIEKVLGYWGESSSSKFVSDYSHLLLPRSINENGVLNIIYKKASNEKKIEILKNLIDQKGQESLDFIKGLGKALPDRQFIIRSLLGRLASLGLQQQEPILAYIPDYINKNDPVDIKDAVAEHIKTLLKSDDPSSEQIGHILLTRSGYLSEEKKREIAQNVLDWIRQPGKNITSSNGFTLRAIAYLADILQQTLVKDFVYTLFNLLRPDRDRQMLEVVMEIFNNIKPQYSEHEKDFKDLFSRLGSWGQTDDRKFVIDKISELKADKPKKEENDFWKQLSDMEATENV